MANQPENGILEDFRIQFLECWHRLPNKGLFLGLLVAWLALFQFVGNSTLGYISTPSLLEWMHTVYSGDDASGSDDGRGRFIPFVVLGLFWWKRKQLLTLPLNTWWPGLLLVAFALVLCTGVYGLMGLAWGRQWLRESFFPFILFVFCVPLGWSAATITFPLQLLVCRVVEFICHNVLAIEIVRDGTKIMDPTGRYQYEVAAACSGIRSLFATLAVAIIYAMLCFRPWWKRGVLMISAVPLAVLGNTVRMLAIVIAADIWGQGAGDYVHEGGPYGIISLLPYVAAFGGLMLLGHWLHESPAQPIAPPTTAPAT